MDEINFDISSDSEGDEVHLRELEQLNAVLEEESRSEFEFPQNISTNTNSLHYPTASTSTAQEELSDIDEALALNKLMDQKYQKLEKILTDCLAECRAKLQEIGSEDIQQERQCSFRYYLCGRPYFRDKNNFPAPPNEDTILMEKTQMYDFSTVVTVPGWSVNDKTSFTNVMLKMSQDIKVQELQNNITRLKREANQTGKDIDDELININKQIKDVKKKSLSQLALPLTKEYDWEGLAIKLNNRHTMQEYRAFWRLFFHPTINKSPWTKSEHKKIQQIASDHNYQDWDKIAQELKTGRTGYQCFVYFRTNMSTTSNGKKWSKEEVEYLKRLIDYYKEDDFIPWSKVASAMQNRTKIQIYNKYVRLKVQRKGRFLPEEDSVILSCYKKYNGDLKKITDFLPGRSIIQVRTRYHILNKNNISAIWTVEEDRKLLQLMSNEDSTTFYSNATRHFPGKHRSHIRSRYMTLVNWMRKNPHWDVSHAPRRAARRLTHGSSDATLNKAVENLEQRMKSEVQTRKSCRLTKESTEKDIEDAIIAALITELVQDEKNGINQEDTGETSGVASSERDNITSKNLKNLLLLLNSQLNCNNFKNSSYSEQHPNLLSEMSYTSDQMDCVVKVKSYSKKEQVKTVTIKNQPTIWGKNLLGTLLYVLPPHYATITGCKALMSVIGSHYYDSEVNINMWLKRNDILKDQIMLLMERFNFLFTWPMMLSNIEPNVKNITSPVKFQTSENTHEALSQSRKRTARLDTSAVTIPTVKKSYLIKKSDGNIDLNDTECKESEINIEHSFPL